MSVRIKMKLLLVFIFIFLLILSCSSQSSSSFDKDKWLTSSEYRYEISKSKDFPDLKDKSKENVKELLGMPDLEYEDEFTYCFDLNPEIYYDPKVNRMVCDCKGSFVTINFRVDKRWKTTFIWVESKK